MGTVTNLRGFYNPKEDNGLSGNQLRKLKKGRKQKKVAKFENVRLHVLKYLKLHDTATLVGICFCIHKETGWNIPERQNQYRSFITKFYRKIRNKRLTRSEDKDEKFYSSKRWKELRFVALRMSEGACSLCGARASDGVRLQVDHIKPRSIAPNLQWDLENLQILCEDCNFGKSNYDDTDYRKW